MAVSQWVSLTQVSQSIENNNSVVRFEWYSQQTGDSYNNYWRTAYFYVSINGGAETTYSVDYQLPKKTTETIVYRNITIPHRADGTGSVKIRTWMDTGISAGSIEKSASLTLTTIPRATTPTISGTKSLGGTITIDVSGRATSSFTHDLYYTWGSNVTDVLIAQNVATSQTFTIPKDLAKYVMAATSGTLVIKCITKNGSAQIGTKTVNVAVSIPDTAEFRPTIQSVAIAEAGTLPFARYVAGKSKLKISVSAVGGYVSGSADRNSFPVSATITVDGKTYTKALGQSAAASWNITTELLSAGSKTVTVVVTDSRGRTASNSATTLTVYAYAAPAISAFTARRCLQDGTLSDSGQYLLCSLKTTISSCDSQNAKTYKIVYDNNGTEVEIKSGTIAGYTNITTTYNSYSNSKVFSVDSAYKVKAYVYDSFNASSPAVYVVDVPTELTFFDWRSNGKGFAFGKVSTKDGVEFAWDVYDKNDFLLGVTSMEIGAGYGHIKWQNGLLLQWGTVSITPTAANVVTNAQIMFDRAYASTPQIGANVQTNVPQVVTYGVGGGTTAAAALTGMLIYMTRTNVNATTFRWWAIGQAA